ncbi:hypothetical protein BA899_01895 [Spiribacter sp. SSL99]|uniref:hypothetical protein n=1 Tax=Spiribacter sp. SSL99 TaxID=1866884 RepID=UPI0013305F67|nr:hypothetical protein [Spiribacter sp. SSL99]KAF0285580.1 hypothetical protein BA899_01895 [Spiribacter sp. SSL99]
MITGKLYLHIGPPKTAATSLQIAMQEADLPRLHYGGTFQPREDNVGSSAQTPHKASCGRLAAGDADVRSALDEIGEHLRGGNLILSEEMFLVEQHDNPFPEKLRRLGDLLSDIPTVVLVTLRDPREGLPSLYQELFNGLPLTEKLSFARFCRGPRARCYDYTFVHENLIQAAFRDIRGIEFHDLTAGEVPLSQVIGHDALTDAMLILRRANSGAKTGPDKRTLPPVSLKSIGGMRPVRASLDRTGLRGTALSRHAAATFDRIRLRPGDERQLRLPAHTAGRLDTCLAGARTRLQPMESPQ